MTEPLSGKERNRLWYVNNREHKLAYQREYREKNKEEVTSKNRRCWHNLKVKVLTHYSRGKPTCACCGENELVFLTLDHLNGDGVKHRKKHKIIAGTQTFLWITKNGYPSGFQVLCYNCNCAKRTNKNVLIRRLINGKASQKTANEKKTMY